MKTIISYLGFCRSIISLCFNSLLRGPAYLLGVVEHMYRISVIANKWLAQGKSPEEVADILAYCQHADVRINEIESFAREKGWVDGD